MAIGFSNVVPQREPSLGTISAANVTCREAVVASLSLFPIAPLESFVVGVTTSLDFVRNLAVLLHMLRCMQGLLQVPMCIVAPPRNHRPAVADKDLQTKQAPIDRTILERLNPNHLAPLRLSFPLAACMHSSFRQGKEYHSPLNHVANSCSASHRLVLMLQYIEQFRIVPSNCKVCSPTIQRDCLPNRGP